MEREVKLLEIAADILDVEIGDISLDSKREDIDSFDSLSIVQIIAEMSDTFNVVISDEKVNAIKIDKISDFLKFLDE